MTPTEKQNMYLTTLSDADLLPHALEAMHALNRRAKEKRDRRNRFRRERFAERLSEEIDRIYRLKDRLLTSLVEVGLATVETFAAGRGSFFCASCDRDWRGTMDDDTCHVCGGTGQCEADRWYVVSVGGHRFHQPGDSASDRMREIATEIAPHDPTQPAREIPRCGLTIEAQHACVEMMITRLRARCGEPPPAAAQDGASAPAAG